MVSDLPEDIRGKGRDWGRICGLTQWTTVSSTKPSIQRSADVSFNNSLVWYSEYSLRRHLDTFGYLVVARPTKAVYGEIWRQLQRAGQEGLGQLFWGGCHLCSLNKVKGASWKKVDETNKFPVMATSGLTPTGRVSAAAAAKEAVWPQDLGGW